jgi:probable rRNA maturation factor
MMEITIDNRQTRIDIDQEDLRKKTEKILEGLGYSSSITLSVSLVSTAEMAELNRTYRGKDGPTNVLSFSQREGEAPLVQPDLIGDVVICTDRADDDAAELGYSREEMVLYLLIHGILHLHGLDHAEPRDAQAMQEEVDHIFETFFPLPEQMSDSPY